MRTAAPVGVARRPAPPAAAPSLDRARPVLAYFRSEQCGRCRRVDSFIAQVLQRRRNHETFAIRQVDVNAHPDLAERFAVSRTPTLVVIERRRVAARLDDPRFAVDIERFLEPWLR